MMDINQVIIELFDNKAAYLTQDSPPSIEDVEYIESLKTLLAIVAPTHMKAVLKDVL